MISLRKAGERGHFNHGWLDTWHTFSFADYYDPEQMGFTSLRVINEDRVAPGRGFAPHSHRDMEIITYILEGVLEHKDSLGNGSVIRPGDVQRMSAGTGVTHSEYNRSKTEPVHLLQIWIMPDKTGVVPSYEQKHYTEQERQSRLRLIASADGRDGSVTIHQNASVYAALLGANNTLTHPLAPGRQAYLHVARGALNVNGHLLSAGDGAKLTAEPEVRLSQAKQAEVLLFDLT